MDTNEGRFGADHKNECVDCWMGDEVVALKAEVERLTDQLNRPVLLSEWQRMEARAEKLESALREMMGTYNRYNREPSECGREMGKIGRAALAEKRGE